MDMPSVTETPRNLSTAPLIAAAGDGYIPFVHHDASVYTGWLTALTACLVGDPTDAELEGVHGLLYELAMAADVFTQGASRGGAA